MKRAAAVAALAAIVAVVLFALAAPGYLSSRGFPLDDAWIHAVYARSLAREFSFAYNPGVPAAGETAPLWPLLLVPVHAVTKHITLATKWVGFTFHLVTAVLATLVVREKKAPAWAAYAAGVLIAVHPDLVAVSVSGMEVPLATACLFGAWVCARRPVPLAVFAACTYLARPELGAIVPILALASVEPPDRKRTAIATFSGLFGGVAIAAFIAFRGSGRWLPSTFYAKAGVGALPPLDRQVHGFGALLGELAVVEHLWLLLIAIGIAIYLVNKSRDEHLDVAGPLAGGVLFCVISFSLVPPFDAKAFYHQRYVLPAVPLLLVSFAHLFARASLLPTDAQAQRASRWLVPIAFLGLGALDVALSFVPRAHKLENDAHNIDDVQVQTGLSLANATGETVWAVDAGAVRYFGSAFVVDMVGLNSPALLGAGTDGAAFLRAHPPRYIELVPTWSSLDPGAFSAMRGVVRRVTTPYTVTSFQPMKEHWLGTCPPGVAGLYRLRERKWAFECAP